MQLLVDENQINYFLYLLFYAEKPFSLAQLMVSQIPPQYLVAGPIIK